MGRCAWRFRQDVTTKPRRELIFATCMYVCMDVYIHTIHTYILAKPVGMEILRRICGEFPRNSPQDQGHAMGHRVRRFRQDVTTKPPEN